MRELDGHAPEHTQTSEKNFSPQTLSKVSSPELVIRKVLGTGILGTNMTTGGLANTLAIGTVSLNLLHGSILPSFTKDLGLLRCVNLTGP